VSYELIGLVRLLRGDDEAFAFRNDEPRLSHARGPLLIVPGVLESALGNAADRLGLIASRVPLQVEVFGCRRDHGRDNEVVVASGSCDFPQLFAKLFGRGARAFVPAKVRAQPAVFPQDEYFRGQRGEDPHTQYLLLGPDVSDRLERLQIIQDEVGELAGGVDLRRPIPGSGAFASRDRELEDRGFSLGVLLERFREARLAIRHAIWREHPLDPAEHDFRVSPRLGIRGRLSPRREKREDYRACADNVPRHSKS
jgi:hypothetical protein